MRIQHRRRLVGAALVAVSAALGVTAACDADTRRESLTAPAPIVSGQIYELEIEIDCTGWVFEPGHRIRLDIASADFPNIWPTPLNGANRVYHGGELLSRL